MARSRYYFYNENGTMRPKLRVTASSTEILCVSEQFFSCEFLSPAKLQTYLRVGVRVKCPIVLTDFNRFCFFNGFAWKSPRSDFTEIRPG